MPHPQRKAPPHILVWMAAFRWQESGNPYGKYNEPNGQGAYGMTQPFWNNWAPKVGVDLSKYPNASSAPKGIQDAVAAHAMEYYYYGQAEKNWRQVAAIWNGGGTPGYADAVVQKAATITPAAAGDYAAGNPVTLHESTSKKQRRKLRHYAAKVASESTPCAHQLSLNLKVTSAHICMDKPIALAAFAGGGTLVLAGITILLVTGFKDTAAGRAAKGAAAALPVGRALTAARATAGRARPAQPSRSAPGAAAATATTAEVPSAAARRAAEAAARERRREQLHRQQLRHRRQMHYDRRQRESAREVHRRATARGRSEPGLGYEPPTRRPPRPRQPLPDKPPF